jgi:hypothetical protein
VGWWGADEKSAMLQTAEDNLTEYYYRDLLQANQKARKANQDKSGSLVILWWIPVGVIILILVSRLWTFLSL